MAAASKAAAAAAAPVLPPAPAVLLRELGCPAPAGEEAATPWALRGLAPPPTLLMLLGDTRPRPAAGGKLGLLPIALMPAAVAAEEDPEVG